MNSRDDSQKKTLDYIVKCAQSFLDAKKVLLFGSRARGDHHKKSDFDIAIEWIEKDHLWAKFTDTVRNNAPTLCELDLINLNDSLTDEFRKKICKDAKVLYERKTK